MTATTDPRALRRVLVTLLIASLSVAATAAIAVILGAGDYGESAGQVVATAIALTIYSLTGLAASRLRRRREELGTLADCELVLFGLGFISAVVAIWGSDDHEWMIQAALVLLVLSLGAGHVSLLEAAAKPRELPASQFVRRATMGVGVLLSLLLSIDVTGSDDTIDPKLIGVVAVLFLLGNALFPLVRLLNGSTEDG